MSYKIGLDAGSRIVREVGEMPFSGNVIPNLWYHHLRHRDEPHLLAIVLLSEIVYWFQPVEVRGIDLQAAPQWEKKFEGEWLQLSHKQLGEKFGVDVRKIGGAITFLYEAGIILRRKQGDTLSILLRPANLRTITYPGYLAFQRPSDPKRSWDNLEETLKHKSSVYDYDDSLGGDPLPNAFSIIEYDGQGNRERSKELGPVYEIRHNSMYTRKQLSEASGVDESTIQWCEEVGAWPKEWKDKWGILRFALKQGINFTES